MSSQPESAAAVSAAVEARSALRLTRSISVTWWYVSSSVVFFELAIVVFAVAAVVEADAGNVARATAGVTALLWWLATLLPLFEYRRRTTAPALVIWRHHLAPFLAATVFGLVAGLITGQWVAGVLPLIQVLMLLNWPPGVRLRMVLAATALLVALAVIDFRLASGESMSASGFQLSVFAVMLPAVTVSSLWWWDVLVALDRARTSEAKLAATQERLRLATDVHDLQGHHLQVIALQLELAERLMPRDPDAGMEQLRAARASVDDARQGTRDLATRFRSVPLSDELANAVDLLRAAGTRVEATVAPDASLAPASALGPVIRETTTNVLRHGGGKWASLSLTRTDGSWRYEIANDITTDAPENGDGAGLDGIARRAAEADGTLEVHREDHTFTVVVTVSAEDPADVRANARADTPAESTAENEKKVAG
ncbi:sensor histidine kinase [Promicromonospora sp. CA-289599]|uniref:sensor histidine kinase n=1 Tax=Promicromonospora sp. CA-289599 TaxID=3240014 RepID=UPI003D932C03